MLTLSGPRLSLIGLVPATSAAARPLGRTTLMQKDAVGNMSQAAHASADVACQDRACRDKHDDQV